MEFEGHWLEQQELSSALSSTLSLFRVYFNTILGLGYQGIGCKASLNL